MRGLTGSSGDDYTERAGRAVRDEEFGDGSAYGEMMGGVSAVGGVCGDGAEGEAYRDLWPLGMRGDEGAATRRASWRCQRD